MFIEEISNKPVFFPVIPDLFPYNIKPAPNELIFGISFRHSGYITNAKFRLITNSNSRITDPFLGPRSFDFQISFFSRLIMHYYL